MADGIGKALQPLQLRKIYDILETINFVSSIYWEKTLVKGSHHTEESKKKLSLAGMGKHKYWFGKTSTFKGKHHTAEANEKNRQAHLGKKVWNKGLKGVQKAWNRGKPWGEESKKRMSEAQQGIYHTKETKIKISASMKILRNKPEKKLKARQDVLNKIKRNLRNGNQITPFYNERACEYFRQFDEINSTKGRYATNRGELCVLGYWLDYINHGKKLIIEWDEEQHYINGKLSEKDAIRQKEIENHFSDYTFIRIREAKYIPEALHLFQDTGA